MPPNLDKAPPVKRHRRKITLTLADETFAAIEQRLRENPGLRTLSAAVDDLILRPSPDTKPVTKPVSRGGAGG